MKAEAFTCFILHLYSSWYSLQIPTSTYAKKKITCASIFQPPQKSPFIPNDTFNITHLHCCNLKHSAHSIHLRKDFQHSKNSYIPNHMSIFQIFPSAISPPIILKYFFFGGGGDLISTFFDQLKPLQLQTVQIIPNTTFFLKIPKAIILFSFSTFDNFFSIETNTPSFSARALYIILSFNIICKSFQFFIHPLSHHMNFSQHCTLVFSVNPYIFSLQHLKCLILNITPQLQHILFCFRNTIKN